MKNGRKILVAVALLAAVIRSVSGVEPKADLRDFAVRAWRSSEGFTDAPVTVITQTRDGYLWVGTGAGLFRFDGLNFWRAPLTKGGTNTEVSVTSLCEDNSGNLWIGTSGRGLYRWRAGQGGRVGLTEGLPARDITSLELDSEGNVWIGSQQGATRYDGRGFRSFTVADGLQTDSVLNIHAARSGIVWITTAGGTCRFE